MAHSTGTASPRGSSSGTGTSAYQYEGAVDKRGQNIWDTFSRIPGKIADGSNADIANDFYHRYKEDLNLITAMNMDSFRFSIAWSRILPNGTISGGINKEGVEFYNSLINEVIAKGMQVSHWFEPYDAGSAADRRARRRALDFMLGWFMHPVAHGEYPPAMRRLVGGRLPAFTAEQSEMLRGYRNSIPIGPPAYTPIFFNYPPGLRELLLYVKRRYNNPTIYITENGTDEANNSTIPISEALKDETRIGFHYKHLQFVHKAIQEGVKVKGYFTWTFMDCFEFGDGFKDRFGLIYVDRATLARFRKKSSYWFADFLRR
ncbi:hypothetical protein OsJ_27885 [Oryza sativa Japonica Group]|uniref:Beta-glucosidase n=1 Tax=Oryza sativa subsp. japonica TaxID=39947 RepID=B9G1Q7_ORYSJ|nr:hypothetical protein OsJ_27885 [Oryza sativa Japonica Group]